jgi:hypothetical protein
VRSAKHVNASSPGRPRLLISLHALYGAAMLVAPGTLCRDAPDPGRARALARLLGARHLGEALLTWRTNPDWMLLSASLDGLHGASMLLIARMSPPWRRLTLASAAGAWVLSAYSLHCCSRRS